MSFKPQIESSQIQINQCLVKIKEVQEELKGQDIIEIKLNKELKRLVTKDEKQKNQIEDMNQKINNLDSKLEENYQEIEKLEKLIEEQKRQAEDRMKKNEILIEEEEKIKKTKLGQMNTLISDSINIVKSKKDEYEKSLLHSSMEKNKNYNEQDSIIDEKEQLIDFLKKNQISNRNQQDIISNNSELVNIKQNQKPSDSYNNFNY
ncbi:hypothetical protein PPERSA_02141 [Pseudocohnilembus persalinus]|uniref:Uncharacterized protein n=1 Tax=Pseudocohnilembus persalinus TaxID=266149 RepID=A0A0V0Q7E2_PSEPJ|nr:hypothetical protein PPERSA_02141 [Pseudocohnilembus persalinus]|eukprot:KRW98163.1 hypothetical protein PPERSA_02141 [Pseudocohnilembus persalinus]